MKSILKSICIVVLAGLSAGQVCFKPGECKHSELLTTSMVESPQVCLKECKTYPECNWFSFNSDSGICYLLKSCNSLSDEICKHCISGMVACSPNVCDATGLCQGTLEFTEITNTKDECLMKCHSTKGCNWFTFDTEALTCFIFSTCSSIDESLTEYISGQQECPTATYEPMGNSRLGHQFNSKLVPRLILVATGDSNNENASMIEVIDVESPDNACQPLENFLILNNNIFGATGGLIDNTYPLMCGGTSKDYMVSNQCYIIGQPDAVSSMISERANAASIVLNNALLVLGGYSGNSGRLNSSEFVTIGKPSVAGPDLPKPVDGHCMIKINESMAILIGGYSRGFSNEVWYLNLANFTWTEGPSLATGRSSHSCSSMLDKSGKQFIVVGGGFGNGGTLDSVEILDLQSQILTQGPALPSRIGGMKMLPTPDNLGVLGIGGEDLIELKSHFWKLQCGSGIHDCSWIPLNQTLQEGRAYFVAMYIPNELATCKNDSKNQ